MSVTPMPGDIGARIGWFCRLRVLHMYVVYAQRWGLDSAVPQHVAWFASKRARMQQPVEWS